ncbi:MAG TPA: hypothetical protein VJ939_07895 [Bacteroidales bacterium]|nr:hypothetical protein [Bacteroidales bacterium]
MKRFSYVIGLLLIFSIPLITGCEEVEGDDEINDPREAFVGEWNCDEELAKRDNYRVSIEFDNNNSSQVLLYNFGLMGSAESANGIVADDNINVPLQNLADGWSGDGSGTLVSDNKIEWTYTLTDGADRYDYIATYTLIE